MIRKFIYKNQEIKFLIKKTKRLSGLKITISGGKKYALVTKPFFVSDKTVEKFLKEKADWILAAREKLKNNKPKLLTFGNYQEFLRNKNQARKLVKEKIEKYNSFYKFSYTKIYIRNQKTRWGSCSSRGNLNFNYRLLFLEEKFQDYIIVHELCHLKEMNHGKNFWNLVSKQIPDYKEIRKNLKKI
ncbi:MAG: M48 family metallopeptidase [Patescibacteria group bacterium]